MPIYCTRDSSCVGSDIGIGSLSLSTYRMSMYASTNICVDRLNTEGGRDPASQLTQTTNKSDAGRHTSNCRKGWRREIGVDTLLPIEPMRTHQRERLAAETTADKDTRLQQMSALQHKPKC